MGCAVLDRQSRKVWRMALFCLFWCIWSQQNETLSRGAFWLEIEGGVLHQITFGLVLVPLGLVNCSLLDFISCFWYALCWILVMVWTLDWVLLFFMFWYSFHSLLLCGSLYAYCILGLCPFLLGALYFYDS